MKSRILSSESFQKEDQTTAIIQARMGSTRLPCKIFKEVDGVKLLKYMLDRVSKSNLLKKTIIATTSLSRDDVVEKFCAENRVECFRGSENDVLDRYYQCAKKYSINTIVRLTSDCPLSDPEIIDKAVNLFFAKQVDYAVNTVPPETSTYPDGSDVEVFSFKALEKAWLETNDAKDREHVTFYFWKYNKNFKMVQLDNKLNWSKYRFTVDYPEDFEVIEFIIKELRKRNSFGHLKEIIEILETNPEIKAKNEKYHFGIGWGK